MRPSASFLYSLSSLIASCRPKATGTGPRRPPGAPSPPKTSPRRVAECPHLRGQCDPDGQEGQSDGDERPSDPVSRDGPCEVDPVQSRDVKAAESAQAAETAQAKTLAETSKPPKPRKRRLRDITLECFCYIYGNYGSSVRGRRGVSAAGRNLEEAPFILRPTEIHPKFLRFVPGATS